MTPVGYHANEGYGGRVVKRSKRCIPMGDLKYICTLMGHPVVDEICEINDHYETHLRTSSCVVVGVVWVGSWGPGCMC